MTLLEILSKRRVFDVFPQIPAKTVRRDKYRLLQHHSENR
jgi:hypothetical protein